ncbi:hypothetical protein AB685_02490 [Bacillus sp. LL01]|uniref:phosphoribosylanthranilate isomerase n=1 Tax=Bacillus sp. LL01 TaxID=1665556 RepID=UPI00064D0045|nr:phosphoribosylanthranilate isomerase [Bacillus sp. LL01]KMJ59752.1 hypothetical protein AB685_02490 [Bacillus sp. LL01]
MPRTEIKFCGNKSLQDYMVAISTEADFIGFVFADSKRQVRAEQVTEWLRVTSPGNKRLVGIFVNQSKAEILHAVQTVPLDVVQCHGDEGPEFIEDLKAECEAEIWKVIHHEDSESVKKAKEYIALVDGIVIDKKKGNQYGGTGTSFDWSYIPVYTKLAAEHDIRCIIAGGINEHTLIDLLPHMPLGIDLSSGIEEDFIKSKEKMILIESMVMEYEKRTNTR